MLVRGIRIGALCWRIVAHPDVRVKVRMVERGRPVVYGRGVMAAFRVLLIAVALTAPVWALHATSVSACSCGSTGASIADAEIVAVGTVTDMRPVSGLPDSSTAPEFLHANVVSEIAVEEYLWGSGGPSLLVYSDTVIRMGPEEEFAVLPGPHPDCSYGLRLDARYLLIFTDANEELWASSCSGTVREIRSDDPLADVRQFLQVPTLEPTPEATQQPQPTIVEFPASGFGEGGTNRSSAWPIALVASGALVLLSGVAILLDRRRAS